MILPESIRATCDEWLTEARRLNDSLETLCEILVDLRTMVAPMLGYRVKEEE